MATHEANLYIDLDHQWIYVDPERARHSPFGGTIAHGYLTLSLILPLLEQLLEVEPVERKLNYGLNSVRFYAPVPVGAKIRLAARLAEVTEIAGGVQLLVTATVELQDKPKPACVAEVVLRFYRSHSQREVDLPEYQPIQERELENGPGEETTAGERAHWSHDTRAGV